MTSQRPRTPWRRRYLKHMGLLSMALPVLAYFILFRYTPMVGMVVALGFGRARLFPLGQG